MSLHPEVTILLIFIASIRSGSKQDARISREQRLIELERWFDDTYYPDL